ncbi:MAG: acyltransferase family protein [Methyloligellaceae bacterium]
MQHRPEIDGLRAIAVIAVVLFHYKIDKAITGGFIGVDVFFVISGFLITRILNESLINNNFSILEFYNRRVRRIFPALFAVYLFVLLYAVSLPFSSDAYYINQGLFASMIFASNILFSAIGGYFGPDLETNPLLHTWSLSVEEQFYVVLPVLLFLLYKLGRKAMFATLIILTCLSFTAGLLVLQYNRIDAFYLTQYRAWELLLGAILAIGKLPDLKKQSLAELMGASGLVLILAGIFVLTPETPFPGYAALMPCLGTVLIIYSTNVHQTLTSKLLSHPVLQFIGLVSYSFYLWHWPILVAYLYYFSENTHLVRVLLILLSFGISVLSWKYIEAPFRKKNISTTARSTVIFAGAALACFFLVSLGLTQLSRSLWNEPPEVVEMQKYLKGYSAKKNILGKCFLGTKTASLKYFEADKCLALSKDKPNYLIFGDSHADHLFYGFYKNYPHINFLQATSGGCKPTHQLKGSKHCQIILKKIWQDFLPQNKLDGIIIFSRWRERHIKILPETVRNLKKYADRVIVLGPIVEYKKDLPRLLAFNMLESHKGVVDRHRDPRQKKIDLRLEKVMKKSGMEYISIYKAICPDECTVQINNVPLQFDYGHVTTEGALEITKRIKPLLFPEL